MDLSILSSGLGDGWRNRETAATKTAALVVVSAAGLAVAVLPLQVAAAMTVAAIVAVAGFVRPQLLLVLLVPAVPFGEYVKVSVAGAGVDLAEILLAVAVASCLARAAASRQLRLSPVPLTRPALLLLAALGLSLLRAASFSLAAVEIVKWLETFIVAVLAARLLDSRWTKTLLIVCLATGTAVGLHGIHQFLTGTGPPAFAVLGRFTRAFGTFGQPNPYGGYLGLTMPLAVGLTLAALSNRRERLGPGWTVFGAVSSCIMVAALTMSWSRGAWLGCVAALAVVSILAAERLGRKALAALAVLLVLASVALAGDWFALPSSVLGRFGGLLPPGGLQDVSGVEVTDENYAVTERLAHWQAALGMWTESPWLGVGIGNYEAAYYRYALPMWPDALGHAHNYYLNLGAEAGLTGVLTYTLLLAASACVVWRASKVSNGWRWGLVMGTMGMLAHFTVHSLVDNLFVHDMYLQLGILVGTAIGHESG